MILLHDPPLLFLKPHKVAGSSFEIALSRFAGPGDIVTPFLEPNSAEEALRAQLGFTGPQNYALDPAEWGTLPAAEFDRARRANTFPARFRSHTSAAAARDRLPLATWQAACKVSIVRNPYDLAVSRYFFSAREGETFAEFWRARPHLLRWNLDQYCIEAEPAIDVFLRFETLAADIAALETRFAQLSGLGETFAAIRAKSEYRPKSATASAMFADAPDVRELVERECRFEIERFGYTLGE